MNRKEQIKKLSDEVTRFINENINDLDIRKVEEGIKKIADNYELACYQIAEKNEQDVISDMLFILGDLMLVNVIYDTDGKEDNGDGVNATVRTQVIAIDHKEQFLKTLDTDNTTERLIYNYVAGKDIKDRFS